MNSKTFQWRSLKTRVTLLSLAIVLTSLWSLSLYVSWTLRTDMQRLLSEQQLSTISQRASNLNAEMTQRLRALEKMAAKISPAMLEQPAALNAFLADRLTPQDPFSDALVVTQLDGTAITELPSGAGLIALHDMVRGDLAKALAAGRPGIGDPMMNPVLRTPVVAMAVPIVDPQGKVLGALTGLTPDALRAGLGNPGTLVAVIDFLCAHEPDLIAAADALGVTPEALASTGRRLAA